MILSCNYPIIHTFDSSSIANIDYEILLNGKVIFEGMIFPYDSSATTTTIDISPICREYLETLYEDRDLNITLSNVPTAGNLSTIHTFTVSSDSNINSADVNYRVMYNYNTDYISQYPDNYNLSTPICQYIDPRQYLTCSGYNVNGVNAYQIYKNASLYNSYSLNSQLFQFLNLDLAPLNLVEGDVVRVVNNGKEDVFQVMYPCRNKYVLYYVNKLGGLDHILMSGGFSKSYSAQYTDIKLYNNRGDRRDFQQKRINTDIDTSYELNTPLLYNNQSQLIDNLIFSPKVFIHDLENNTVTSCLITDSSVKEKQFPKDNVLQYTIKVKESQKSLRK